MVEQSQTRKQSRITVAQRSMRGKRLHFEVTGQPAVQLLLHRVVIEAHAQQILAQINQRQMSLVG
jgi:hypothetical protein